MLIFSVAFRPKPCRACSLRDAWRNRAMQFSGYSWGHIHLVFGAKVNWSFSEIFQMLVCPVFYQLNNTVSRMSCCGLILQSEAQAVGEVEIEREKMKKQNKKMSFASGEERWNEQPQCRNDHWQQHKGCFLLLLLLYLKLGWYTLAFLTW